MEALLTVSPPTATAPLAVTVAARYAGTSSVRSITTEIGPEAISEFARMVENDLYYGEGADIFGKIYVGGDVAFRNGANTGEVHADVFAHGHIGRRVGRPEYGPPTFVGDAEGWDSSGNHHDIAEVFPVPLDFNMSWDDLDLHREAACAGGICLDRSRPDIPATTEAYLVEFVSGRMRISYATANPSAPSCVSAEEVWWLESQDASWTQLGVYDMPPNGALWADDHVVVGRNSGSPSVVDGALTIYAGTSSNRKNVVIAADIIYAGGAGGTDVIGLIASDELRTNPNAVGTDAEINVAGAILNQNGNWRTASDCGDSGSRLTPADSTLNTFGSTASIGTGNMSGHFETRNYAFDARLERLRPPFFPILNSDWRYTNWRETNLPTWATN